MCVLCSYANQQRYYILELHAIKIDGTSVGYFRFTYLLVRPRYAGVMCICICVLKASDVTVTIYVIVYLEYECYT